MAFEAQMTRHGAVRADRVTKDNSRQTRAQVQAKALAQTGWVAADARAREDEDEEKKKEKEEEEKKEEDTKRREVVAATLSPLPSLKTGDRITVAGTSRDDLNGQCGTVKSFDASKERFNVNLDTGRVLALRGANLVAGLLGRSSLRESAESGTQTQNGDVSHAEKDGDDVGSLMRVMLGRQQQQNQHHHQQQQQQHVSAPPQPPPDRIGVMQKKGGLRHNWTRRNFCLSGGLLLYYAEAVPLLPEAPPKPLNAAAAGGVLSPTGEMSPTVKGKLVGRKAEKGVEPRGYVPLMGAVARVVVGGKYEHEFEVTLQGG